MSISGPCDLPLLPVPLQTIRCQFSVLSKMHEEVFQHDRLPSPFGRHPSQGHLHLPDQGHGILRFHLYCGCL